MSKRTFLVITLLLSVGIMVFAQSPAWWEPAAPLSGQSFTVYYDDIAGTLPNNSSQCWLHWGIYNPVTGGWTAPPASIWPAGSNIAPDGYACQSPMVRGLDNYWYVTIDPDTSIDYIAFVLTDKQNHWDNNNGENWTIIFTAFGTVSWWYPEDPLPGDVVTVYYDCVTGTLPTNAVNVKLHWGMNEIGSGNWIEPPNTMWPAGTIPAGDGHAVQSPMVSLGGGVWSVEIPTNDTTFTMHYVVTNGTIWDNNGGANWNIFLEEPPPVVMTHHVFRYDTRSRWAVYKVEDITNVKVAGTFNGWSSTANPMTGPDSNGVYKTEVMLPVGANDYKFVINGNIWVQDPDNPNTDGSSYMNSRVVTEADTVPYFIEVIPGDNSVYHQSDYLNISAIVRPSDFGPGIMGEPFIVRTVFGYTDTMDVNYNPTSGLMTTGFMIGAPYTIELKFVAVDSSGRVGSITQFVVPVAMVAGYAAKDCRYDASGDGDYTYPVEFNGAVDFEGFYIDEDDGGDSLTIYLNYWIQDSLSNASALIQICTEMDGFYYDPPLFANEIATPDWNGNGVQICIEDPNGPGFDPAVHNRVIRMRDPVSTGVPVNYLGDCYFKISVADLEAVLGSYNRGWYWSACSFIDGPAGTTGHSWEVDAAHGGSDQLFDPDVYDLMFVDNREVQKTLLSNYSGNRRASLDNVGRGFALIYPEEIGPNVGNNGPQMDILTQGAPTIEPSQTIAGIADFATASTVTLHQGYSGGEHIYTIPAVTDTFEYMLILEEGANTIWASAVANGDTGISPSIIFNLEVEHSPQAELNVSYNNNVITLDASASVDPDSQQIAFLWSADPDNPDPVILNNANQAVCTFTEPVTPGEYYFNVTLTDPDNNITEARTFARVYADSVHGFDWNESAQWVGEALFYEIFPRSYSSSHQLSEITDNMEQIADWGYNAIWLMPIFPGPTDHGYAIVDYYDIEEDYGTLEDFSDLVETAHSYDIKIILDMVINHTSIEHPFMQDAMNFGEFSHYYDYYDRDALGNYTYYYDWLSLPNLNYDNPEVWDYFIDVSKWWIEEFDVDGYRCDVAWGPQERNPEFWIEWRRQLKLIKPEVFLLAEATSTDFTFFDHRFDAAMDWNVHHEAPTNFGNLFPGPANLNQLHDAITNYGYAYPQYHYPFRFLENHDETRYISNHTPEQTKLAAALLLTIPGIPLVYAGQEIGTTSQRGQIAWGTDPYDVAEYYYKLTNIRTMFPALWTADMQRLNNSQYSSVYSIGRYKAGEIPIISVMNFASWSSVVTVNVPMTYWNLQPDSLYCLNELLGNSHIWLTGSQLTSITTSLNGYQARIYAISDSAITLDTEETEQPVPLKYALMPNYPNPFNQECVIMFQLPKTEKVKLAVYNILGQRVAMLAEGTFEAGNHSVKWNGRNDNGGTLSSGIYLYQIQAGDFVRTGKMILLK